MREASVGPGISIFSRERSSMVAMRQNTEDGKMRSHLKDLCLDLPVTTSWCLVFQRVVSVSFSIDKNGIGSTFEAQYLT